MFQYHNCECGETNRLTVNMLYLVKKYATKVGILT